MGLRLFSRARTQGPAPQTDGPRPSTAEDPLEQAAQQGRWGAILNGEGELRRHPEYKEHAKKAEAQIDAAFGIVPEGYATLPVGINDDPGCDEEDTAIEPFLLARHATTNREFQRFVDAGGYQNLDLWPEEIWPHLIEFKDLGESPGPRYWRDGRQPRKLADHPVVGVSWHEANAYAAWVGYRLPTEAEWQMAATWRVRSSAHVRRRYPWGDALDLRHCNIWASGKGGTVPVGEYAGGAAPNGVSQLIGNVWEWTGSDFGPRDDEGRVIIGEMAMKGIRGGAFDTYFPWQATGTFRTGLAMLARTQNIGLRCVIDLPR
jgi:iron(II)-dependent oxidoreductase